MDANKVGKAIAYLRKRAGYTQKDLADRIGISDKAVSKWERGAGLPEIGYLRKLSILLDTDTDSLLAGDVVHHDSSWYGIIVLDENDYDIGAGTIVYDKPLINYLLSYFMLVGIRDIWILGSESDREYIENRYGKGDDYGIRLTVLSESTLGKALNRIHIMSGNVMMVYGRCLLYGVDQTRFFQKAMIDREHFRMLALPKKINDSAAILMDSDKRVLNKVHKGKQLRTQYDFSSIPIIFFPYTYLKKIAEYDNVKLYLEDYLKKNEYYVETLDRGFVEIEIDNRNDVNEASVFIKIVQDRCGMNVYCLEEVAYRRGMIDLEQLRKLGGRYSGTEYGEYVLGLVDKLKGCER